MGVSSYLQSRDQNWVESSGIPSTDSEFVTADSCKVNEKFLPSRWETACTSLQPVHYKEHFGFYFQHCHLFFYAVGVSSSVVLLADALLEVCLLLSLSCDVNLLGHLFYQLILPLCSLISFYFQMLRSE